MFCYLLNHKYSLYISRSYNYVKQSIIICTEIYIFTTRAKSLQNYLREFFERMRLTFRRSIFSIDFLRARDLASSVVSVDSESVGVGGRPNAFLMSVKFIWAAAWPVLSPIYMM